MPKPVFAIAQSTPVPRNVRANVEQHVRLASLAGEHGARLVLFPELSLTGYDLKLQPADALDPSHELLRPLQAVADENDLTVVTGGPVLSPAGLHIGAISFLPRAAPHVYLKQHVHESEKPTFCSGPGGTSLQIDDQVVALAVCADLTHAEHAQEAANQNATIYAASCFLTEQGYARDFDMLRGYAKKHRMAVLMANFGSSTSQLQSAGRSTAWSETAELVASAPVRGEALIVVSREEQGWKEVASL